MRLSQPVTSFLVYGLSIILMKGFSLVTIPLLAWKLPTAAFGELDLATSLIEFAALFGARPDRTALPLLRRRGQ